MLLLPGRYGKVTPPPDGVFLQGSGAGATYIEGPLVFTKQSQGLREVTVTGGEVAITVSGTAVIEDVVIENAQTAIVVNGELTADRLTVTRIDGWTKMPAVMMAHGPPKGLRFVSKHPVGWK